MPRPSFNELLAYGKEVYNLLKNISRVLGLVPGGGGANNCVICTQKGDGYLPELTAQQKAILAAFLLQAK